MIVVNNITYRIRNTALVSEVSLNIPAGELFALIGANGAGKTTLLRLIAGDMMPESGEIRLNGKAVHHYKPRELARKRAFMPQQPAVAFDFTAFDVVMMGRHPHIRRGETREDHKIVQESLIQTAAWHLKDQLFVTLSAGEQARVTLARVLAQQTPVLLLDEPTSALDLRHQQLALSIARQLADNGATVIAVLHDLNLAAMYADRIGMMEKGRLVFVGTPLDVLTPENIEKVFHLPVKVMPHPAHPSPLIVSLPPVNGKSAS